MSKRKVCTMGVGFWGAILVVWLGHAPQSMGQESRPASLEGTGQGKRAQAFIEAFNKGDAKAVSEFWTPEGAYTDQAGREYKGRAALEKMYKQFFAENQGAKLTIHVKSLRAISADVAMEEGITEVVMPHGDPPTAAKFVAVLVKKGDAWYFENVHDSVALPPSNAEHFDGLTWLLGEWVGESQKGQSAQFSYEWAENRNFIVSHFAITVNGVPVSGGRHILAWDAADKTIRSWSFYSGGGFGEGTWKQNGNKWTIQTTSKTPNGKQVSMSSVVEQTDADHMTWQVTEVSIDGKKQPAGTLVKLKRVGSDRR